MQWLTIDWASVAIGAALSIPAGLLANALFHWLRTFLDRRRILVTEKRKAAARKAYLLLRQYKNGEKDINLYFFALMPVNTIFATLTGVAMVLSFLSPRGLGIIPLGLDPERLEAMVKFGFFFISLVGMMFLIIIQRHTFRLFRRYNYFVDYERELKDRFGDDVLSNLN